MKQGRQPFAKAVDFQYDFHIVGKPFRAVSGRDSRHIEPCHGEIDMDEVFILFVKGLEEFEVC